MKYSDLANIKKKSKEGGNWQNLIGKSFMYGVMYGAGCYAVRLFLKSELGA